MNFIYKVQNSLPDWLPTYFSTCLYFCTLVGHSIKFHKIRWEGRESVIISRNPLCFPQYWAPIQTWLKWCHTDMMLLLIFSEQYIKEKIANSRETQYPPGTSYICLPGVSKLFGKPGCTNYIHLPKLLCTKILTRKKKNHNFMYINMLVSFSRLWHSHL